jgi:multidrug resistance efflux pump
VKAAETEVEIGKRKIEQTNNELEITRVDFNAEKQKFESYMQGRRQGLNTGLTAVEAEQKFRAAEQKRLKAEIEVKQAEADLLNKEAKLEETKAKTLSELAKFQADLDQANAKIASYQKEVEEARSKVRNQGTQHVRAPRDGIIKRLLVNEGVQQLKDTDPIALLIPKAPDLAVEIYLDGNDTPLVHVGDAVRLQFEGWPAVQFPGWPSVAIGTFAGKVYLIEPGVSGKGKFRILVEPTEREPWPSGRYLRQGVQARGWVLLREVPLGYELWRRLNGFPPIVAPEEPGKGDGKGGKELTGLGSSYYEDDKEKVKLKRPK